MAFFATSALAKACAIFKNSFDFLRFIFAFISKCPFINLAISIISSGFNGVSEHTESQSFIWEDSQYILSNEIHLQNIYQIILNFDDITVETNVIKSKDLCLLYYKN